MQHIIHLVRNNERAIGIRKQIAASDNSEISGLRLGSTVITPDAFLEEAWGLFGDGHILIDAATRTLYMMSTLHKFARENHDDFNLSPTLGTAKLLGNFVERYAGVTEFEEALAMAANASKAKTNNADKIFTELSQFSKSQLQVLQVLSEYFQVIENAGLIEPSSAATLLTNSTNLESIRALGKLKITEELFVGSAVEKLFGLLDGESPAKAKIEAPDKKVKTDFKFAAGATALKQIVYAEITATIDASTRHSHIVVFAENPIAMYNALAPYLYKNDYRVACKTRMQVNETQLGKALHAMLNLVEPTMDGANWRTSATDFAYSKLAEIPPMYAQNFNTEIRRDSLMSREQGLERLKEISPTAAAFEAFVRNPSHENLESLHLNEDELGLGTLTSLVTTYEGNSASNSATFFEIWESVAIKFSQLVSPNDDAVALIEFRPTSAFDSFAPGSIDAIIFADLTKDVISIPAARPATDSILTVMNIENTRDLYQEKRTMFANAIAAARTSISIVMPMRNSAGAQLYPSFLYDEFVQSISEGETKTVDDEKVFAVPAAYDTTLCITDESNLEAGFGEVIESPKGTLRLKTPSRGTLKTLNMKDFVSHYDGLPVLSPSQIETYTKCPYNWFASRKLRLNDFDESLDNMRLGSFAHAVFERTFNTLAEDGVASVTEDNVEDVKKLATTLFDQILSEQKSLDPQAKRRCVGSDEHDEASLRILKKQILATIDNMPLLPTEFSVWNHEVKIGPEHGRLVRYANESTYLNGSIDRVDINEASSSYIIYDYKGSIVGHDAGLSEDKSLQELPEKVQTLIYAQALGKLNDEFKLNAKSCVGAMYLGYKKAQDGLQLAGSADSGFPELSSLTTKSSIVQTGTEAVKDFQAFLDAVESQIAIEIQKMQNGVIAPKPKTPKACEFCDVAFCEMRKVAEGNE